jgi:crossover junction endodeoxyribonuclease RuvC
MEEKLNYERIIIGIDPGTNVMGYGILGVNKKKLELIAMGVIQLNKFDDHYMRLRRIYERVTGLITQYLPDEMAIEAPFFGKNVQSMLKLGRAQGVAMAAALSCNREVFEYAPSRIKQSVVGLGSASKEQIAGVVMRTLHIEQAPRKADATDGMAVALCHYYSISSPINQALGTAKVKGLGGDKKARKRGSESWEHFISHNPNRVL